MKTKTKRNLIILIKSNNSKRKSRGMIKIWRTKIGRMMVKRSITRNRMVPTNAAKIMIEIKIGKVVIIHHANLVLMYEQIHIE